MNVKGLAWFSFMLPCLAASAVFIVFGLFLNLITAVVGGFCLSAFALYYFYMFLDERKGDSFELNNKEKLLSLFGGLHYDGLGGIEKGKLQSMLYLIKDEVNNSFTYDFTFRPVLYSDEFEDDLDDLVRSGLLTMQSPINITPFGVECYQALGNVARSFFNNIGNLVKNLNNKGYPELEKLVYFKQEGL